MRRVDRHMVSLNSGLVTNMDDVQRRSDSAIHSFATFKGSGRANFCGNLKCIKFVESTNFEKFSFSNSIHQSCPSLLSQRHQMHSIFPTFVTFWLLFCTVSTLAQFSIFLTDRFFQVLSAIFGSEIQIKPKMKLRFCSISSKKDSFSFVSFMLCCLFRIVYCVVFFETKQYNKQHSNSFSCFYRKHQSNRSTSAILVLRIRSRRIVIEKTE